MVIDNDEVRKQIIGFLTEEIDTSVSERENYLKKVDIWRRQREARPIEEEKSWPWPKASNVVPPLAMTNTNSIFAAMKAKFGAMNPLFTVTTDNPELVGHAECLTEYLALLTDSKFHLNLREVNNTTFYDLVSIGTQFVKIPWTIDVFSFKGKTPEGQLLNKTITKHDGPSVVPIRIEDFFTRAYVTDLQTAPWFGVCNHIPYHELKQREAQGIYMNIDSIKEFYATADDNLERQRQRMGFSEAENEMMFDIYECNVFWDVDEDGIPEDIVIWFEKDSGIVIREEFNDLGFRPVVELRYLQFPHQLYGLGVGWICQSLQDEAESLHNNRNNSLQLSSMQMAIVGRSTGIGEKEYFFPGRMIKTDNPRDDFFPFKFPDIGPSSLQAEYLTLEYADRATGASNAMMGQPDNQAKTRATASGTMFLAQQASRLFDAVSDNTEKGLAEIGQMVVFQLIRHKDRVKDLDSLLPKEKADKVKEILDMELDEMHLNFTFRVSTTEIDQTEEAKRQALLTLSQLYTMYEQQVLGLIQSNIQLAMQLQSPEMLQPLVQKYMQFSSKFLEGQTDIMEKVAKYFNVEDKGLIPVISSIRMMNELIGLMDEQQAREMENGLQRSRREQETGAPNRQITGVNRAGGPPGAGQTTAPQGGGNIAQ